MVPGVTDNDVSRWRRGEWERLSGPKRRVVRAFVEQRRVAGPGFWPEPKGGRSQVAERAGDYGVEGQDEAISKALVVTPDLARRLVGQVRPEDRRTRLAILQEIESGFIEKNMVPPAWFEDLRREVLGI